MKNYLKEIFFLISPGKQKSNIRLTTVQFCLVVFNMRSDNKVWHTKLEKECSTLYISWRWIKCEVFGRRKMPCTLSKMRTMTYDVLCYRKKIITQNQRMFLVLSESQHKNWHSNDILRSAMTYNVAIKDDVQCRNQWWREMLQSAMMHNVAINDDVQCCNQ